MPKVIIVGSDTPSTYLARGERRGPVELTDDLRKLIRGGYVNIVETIVTKPVTESDSDQEEPTSGTKSTQKPVKRSRRRLATATGVELPADQDEDSESDG